MKHHAARTNKTKQLMNSIDLKFFYLLLKTWKGLYWFDCQRPDNFGHHKRSYQRTLKPSFTYLICSAPIKFELCQAMSGANMGGVNILKYFFPRCHMRRQSVIQSILVLMLWQVDSEAGDTRHWESEALLVEKDLALISGSISN